MFTIETIEPAKLKEMSAQELERYNQKLMAGRDSLKLESRFVQQELSRRAALAKYDAMGDEEKAALLQVVKAQSVVANSKVSSPGA